MINKITLRPSNILLHFLANVLIVSRFGQKRLLNALNLAQLEKLFIRCLIYVFRRTFRRLQIQNVASLALPLVCLQTKHNIMLITLSYFLLLTTEVVCPLINYLIFITFITTGSSFIGHIGVAVRGTNFSDKST